ncbi:hypothetical protein MRX96_058360 [Rhipicephalus microplus]
MHCNGQQKALVKRKRKTRVPDKSASAVQVPSSISPEQSLSTVTELGSIKCRQPRVRVSPIDGGSKGVARVPFGADVSAGRGGPAVPPPVAALPPTPSHSLSHTASSSSQPELQIRREGERLEPRFFPDRPAKSTRFFGLFAASAVDRAQRSREFSPAAAPHAGGLRARTPRVNPRAAPTLSLAETWRELAAQRGREPECPR